MKKIAIVLAAGKGIRMKSELPKVSHQLMGIPMIARVLGTLKAAGLDEIFVVVGYKADIVMQECKGFNVTFVEQKEQLGTGHAVAQARPHIKGANDAVLVLSGDVPLLKTSTIKGLLKLHVEKRASATVLTASMEDPSSYGRIIRDSDGSLSRIVEQKDASPKEAQVREVNSGTYCFISGDLFTALEKVKPNNVQKEYYLTDVIGILKGMGKSVHAYMSDDPEEVIGVNTIEDLKRIEESYKDALL